MRGISVLSDEYRLLRDILSELEEDHHRMKYTDWLEELSGTVPCGKCHGSGLKAIGVVKRGGSEELGLGPQKMYVLEPPPPTLIGCPDCGGDGLHAGSGRVPDGLAARAEFIRVQCELARPCPSCRPGDPRACGGPNGIKSMACRTDHLRRRERELFDFHNIQRWFRDPGPVFDRYTTDPAEFDRLSREVCPAMGISAAFVRRGFVEAVTCTAADFLRHEKALFASHPITRVTLTQLFAVDTPTINVATAAVAALCHRHGIDWRPDLGWNWWAWVLRAEWPRVTFEYGTGGV